MDYCFAWAKNPTGKWGCKAITAQCDGLNTECPFYKSEEQQKASVAYAYNRLYCLMRSEQTSIAEKYYGEKQPWRPNEEKHA